MRKTRFIALLLAAILTLSCMASATTYAADTSESSTEEAVDSATPYFLKTKQDESDTNKVQVWLELDPARAESVASYQVALQLMNGEGSAALGRGMELTFDETLDSKAKIKEADFDPDTQIMQIYVAGTENLIKITKDEKGNTVNKLPIGTLQVDKLRGEENSFKIALSGNTGDLTTVDLSMASINAAEAYGADFEIPVDGVVYGEPARFPFSYDIEGKGTVKAYIVRNDAEELVNDDIFEYANVRLRATPAEGYRLTEITLIDSADEEHKVKLGGDFKFTMESSVTGVKAVFKEIEKEYTVTVKGNGSITGTSESEAKYKSRAVASVSAKASAGEEFSCWKNEKGDVVSYKPTYSFAVLSNITLTPEFVASQAAKTEEPSVILNVTDVTDAVTPLNGKYRLSYSGACTVPSGYKLVQKGIVLINQPVDNTNINKFVIGGQINNVNVATCAVSGTADQFIANVNNVKGGQLRVARAFMTYSDSNGNTNTIYSSNAVALTTP